MIIAIDIAGFRSLESGLYIWNNNLYFHIYCYRMLGTLRKAYFFIVLYLSEVSGFHNNKNS